VQWIVDAVLIERASEGRIRWDELARRAKEWNQALTLAAALTFLRSTFEVQVPDPVLQELHNAPATPLQRLAHRIKIGPRRTGRLSRAVRLLAWRWDAARRVAAAPYSAQGGPGGLFSFLREYWGLPSRRATLGRILRKLAPFGRARA
jgi:hypothetical protein